MVKAKKTYKKGGKFPDLTGDGKVTMADVLKGRKVFEEGGKMTPMQKKKVTGVNQNVARYKGKSISRASGTTSSKKGGKTTMRPSTIPTDGKGNLKMKNGGKVTARKAKRTERQAGKEDRFAARNRMQPDPRTKEQKAAAYRKRRNKRLTRAMMGAITGAVVGGGEYNVRQRKS